MFHIQPLLTTDANRDHSLGQHSSAEKSLRTAEISLKKWACYRELWTLLICNVHCTVVEDEVQTPLILITAWEGAPKWADHPHFSWYKVSYLLQLSGLYSTEGRRQTGIRRCQGTCPSFLGPWPPSSRPCRHATSLQTRGHLTSQTTVLGNYPDGSLNEKKDTVLAKKDLKAPDMSEKKSLSHDNMLCLNEATELFHLSFRFRHTLDTLNVKTK